MYTELMTPYTFSNELFRRLNYVLNSATGNETDWPFGAFSSGELATNVWEDGNAFYVEMEVPGAKKDDIDLSLLGSELTIKINRDREKEEKDAQYLRRERIFGTTVRTIALPFESSPKEMEATVEHGVLRIRFVKPEEVKARKIAITAK